MPNNIPGRLRSYVYFARPETLSGPSILETRLPIQVRLSASGHLYSAMLSTSLHGAVSLGCLEYGSPDPDVGSTAAKVSAQAFLDFLRCRIPVLVKECLAGDHETWSAKPALLAVVVNKRLLDRMQAVVLSQPLDCGDLLALRLDGQHRAGIHRVSIHNHSTSAASASVAHPLGAGDVKLVPHGIQQRCPRFDLAGVSLAIDFQRYRSLARPIE